MIKLIASDLDGTLIGPDNRFRPRTLQALHAAADAGIQVVFVTGRPLRWMSSVLDQLGEEWNGENSHVFCSNGAVTYDIARGEVVDQRTVDASTILRIHSTLVEAFPAAHFIAETLETVYMQGDLEPHEHDAASTIITGSLQEILPADAQVVKYLIFNPGQTPAVFLEQVQAIVGDSVSATRSAPYQPLVEIARYGLNKGDVLADFAANLGISPQEVAAFGDMPNDFEMLDWAGHGYVMDSGLPELKERVGRVCPAFEEDGVAQVIEGLLAARQGS